jgi:hypothetical protein
MSLQEPIRRYKYTGGGSGLVRVEVIVPADDRERVRDLAKELRRSWRENRARRSSVPNREAVNDRAKLILHRLVARRLRRDPALVEQARARLCEMTSIAPDDLEAWTDLLNAPVTTLAHKLGERSDTMTRLRSVSPFILEGVSSDVAWRRRLWRKAALGAS